MRTVALARRERRQRPKPEDFHIMRLAQRPVELERQTTLVGTGLFENVRGLALEGSRGHLSEPLREVAHCAQEGAIEHVNRLRTLRSGWFEH